MIALANTRQLHLTPKESERLRQVSYQRQLEAGFRNPGHAGLVPLRTSIEELEAVRKLQVEHESAQPSDLSSVEKA